MNIAIIGSGNVGGTLAETWGIKGHSISLGVRDVISFKGIELLRYANIDAHPIADAVKKSEVILLAAVPEATATIVSQMGNVKGKVIIDAMNSWRTRPEGYRSTFEALKALAKGAEIVKCFNTTGFENMKDPVFPSGPIDMFMAGDSKKGKEIATKLAQDAGFGACHDFGGDAKVPLLEQFAFAWINLAITQGAGRNIALKVVKR